MRIGRRNRTEEAHHSIGQYRQTPRQFEKQAVFQSGTVQIRQIKLRTDEFGNKTADQNHIRLIVFQFGIHFLKLRGKRHTGNACGGSEHDGSSVRLKRNDDSRYPVVLIPI